MGEILLSRLGYVSVYSLIPLALCFLLTRGPNTNAAFRLWVWRGFFVVLSAVLVLGPLMAISVAGAPTYGEGTVQDNLLVALPIAIWAAGVLFLSARMALEERTARRLLRQSEPITDPAILALTAQVGRQLGLCTAVSLVSTNACRTPMVIFDREPVVILPDWTTATLTREEVGQVLAHEMAHIRGRDGAWAGFQSVITAVLWFHPLVWMAGRQAAIAVEMQADSVALKLCSGSPSRLAKTILLCVTGAQPANVAALSGNGRKLAMRLLALEKPSSRLRPGDMAAVVLALILAFPFVPSRPSSGSVSIPVSEMRRDVSPRAPAQPAFSPASAGG